MPNDKDKDARGLMVIKASTKTKARQRKGAISNWKVGLIQKYLKGYKMCKSLSQLPTFRTPVQKQL